MTTPEDILKAALEYKAAGLEVIPDHPQYKYPYGYSNWQSKEFTEDELKQKILNEGWGVGIRNIEGLDFDNKSEGAAKELVKKWHELLNKIQPDLFNKLTLWEETQHGGYHTAWKCSVIEENKKLARRPATEKELEANPQDTVKGLIETRGLGGQFVVAPTYGYKILKGSWADLPTITPEERSILLKCAAALDESPKFVEFQTKNKDLTSNDERPGDKFNKEGHEEALQLLIDNGWQVLYEKGNAKYLRRPGKDERGISATFGYVAPGVFYCFTTSAEHFEAEHAYSPFAVYAFLNHSGNFRAAAAALAEKYGMPKLTQKVDRRLTDAGNAELIRDLYGNRIRYDHRRSRWLVWKDNMWVSDKEAIINRLAIKSARRRFKQAVEIKDKELREKVARWSISSENRGKVDAATYLLRSLDPVSDKGEEWDQDPMLLSVENGIIDLTTGEIRSGKPEDKITMCANAKYDKSAICPRWLKFLDEVFEGNIELIDYIQRALGYSITGKTTEQAVFFCFGVGSNGKSVMFETINEILGDYGYTAPATLFQRNQYNTSSNDAAAIEFKRFLINSEVLSATRINEQRLKKWSGGDKETARYLYSEYFTFRPVCKIWLFVNHKPVVEDESLGFWRRMRLIPFNRIFKPNEQDPELIDKLREEKSGILNWLIDGCLMWQEKGLRDTPQVIREATQLYREENDVLAEFISQQCTEDPESKTLSTILYQEYSRWANNSGLTGRDILSVTKFGIKMTDKFVKRRTGDGVFYIGVRLKTSQNF